MFTPWEGQKFGGQLFLPYSQTICPYTSNKPLYIKFGQFLGALSTILTFLVKKGRFFEEKHESIFYSKIYENL